MTMLPASARELHRPRRPSSAGEAKPNLLAPWNSAAGRLFIASTSMILRGPLARRGHRATPWISTASGRLAANRIFEEVNRLKARHACSGHRHY